MTTNSLVLTVVWLGLALHVLAGFLTARHASTAPLIPILNLLVSGLILAFWAQRWYGYLFRGIRWYATDQLVPAYAVAVCIVAGMALWGRHPNMALNATYSCPYGGAGCAPACSLRSCGLTG